MAGPRIHWKTARRRAISWQAAALVLALAAAGLWALEIPGISGQVTGVRPQLPAAAEPRSGAVEPAAPPGSGVITAMAERLELARKGRPAAATTPATTPTAGASNGGMNWRYLGSIIEPTRKLALLSINGSQRVLAEGRSIDQADPSGRGTYRARLLEVRPDLIVVDDNGRRIEIPKDDPVGPRVSWVPPGAGGVASMSGVGNPGGLTPEQIRQAAARGIDPAAAERLRQTMAERRGRPAATPPNPANNPGGFRGAAGAVRPAATATRGGATQSDATGGDASGDATGADDGSKGSID